VSALASTVVVTGGSRGIGLEITRVLLDRGHHVVVVARRTTEEYEALRSRRGRYAEFWKADLCQRDDLYAVARRIRGFRTLYGLVNNAGVASTGLHLGLPRSEMDAMMSVNVMAPMVLSQAAVKAMMQARVGRIVTISSVCAQRPYRGLAVYSATKAALEGFSRVLAAESGAWGITVNCVAPGFVDTAMSEGVGLETKNRIRRRAFLPREVSTMDVAEVVAFLLSAKSAGITAEVLRVDAGAAA
jgi:3-oxoacyl-[acyl-carrier protein] reductase